MIEGATEAITGVPLFNMSTIGRNSTLSIRFPISQAEMQKPQSVQASISIYVVAVIGSFKIALKGQAVWQRVSPSDLPEHLVFASL